MVTSSLVQRAIHTVAFGIAISIISLSGSWMLKDPFPFMLIPVKGKMKSLSGRIVPCKMQLASVVGLVVLPGDGTGTWRVNGLIGVLG